MAPALQGPAGGGSFGIANPESVRPRWFSLREDRPEADPLGSQTGARSEMQHLIRRLIPCPVHVRNQFQPMTPEISFFAVTLLKNPAGTLFTLASLTVPKAKTAIETDTVAQFSDTFKDRHFFTVLH